MFKLISLGLFLVSLAVFSLLTVKPVQAQTIFYDDFNGTIVDNSKWSTCYWFGCTNFGNNELEWYQDANIGLNNGILSLTALQEPVLGTVNGTTKIYPYTSGMLSSHTKFSYLYGYAEIRAKTPYGKGLWPTFFLLPEDHTWPPEIDILEQIGGNTQYMTVHYYQANNYKFTSQTFPGNFNQDFHTYGMKWSRNLIEWYVDGVKRAEYGVKKNIPNKPMYLIVNLAVGGNFPGSPDSTTIFPSQFEIDYIKVTK